MLLHYFSGVFLNKLTLLVVFYVFKNDLFIKIIFNNNLPFLDNHFRLCHQQILFTLKTVQIIPDSYSRLSR